MSYSVLSDSFEYLCHGSTTIRNIFTLTVPGSTLVFTDVKYRRLKLVPALEGLNNLQDLTNIQIEWSYMGLAICSPRGASCDGNGYRAARFIFMENTICSLVISFNCVNTVCHVGCI